MADSSAPDPAEAAPSQTAPSEAAPSETAPSDSAGRASTEPGRSGNDSAADRLTEIQRREARLRYREQQLEQREKELLSAVADSLREAGCQVRLPGNWVPETPAKALDLPPALDRALQNVYDSLPKDPRLTARSYVLGDLSIADLAADIPLLRSLLKKEPGVGARSVQVLEERLDRAGVLDASAETPAVQEETPAAAGKEAAA